MLESISEIVMSKGIFEFILELKDTLFAFLSVGQPPLVILSINLFLFKLGISLKADHFICYFLSNVQEGGFHVAFELLPYACKFAFDSLFIICNI